MPVSGQGFERMNSRFASSLRFILPCLSRSLDTLRVRALFDELEPAVDVEAEPEFVEFAVPGSDRL
jgi:hypothetical protein